METDIIAKKLTLQLLKNDFIVHRKNAKTTSVYLKMDYGVSCGIRIGDHPGRQQYYYRFNVMKNYRGNKVVYRDNHICYFYNYHQLNQVIEDVKQERLKKVTRYGLDGYKKLMEEYSKSDLFKRFNRVKKVKGVKV